MTLLTSLIIAFSLAQAAGIDGRYSGTWSSDSSGQNGKIHLVLKTGPDALSASAVTFTLDGAEVKTRMRSLEVEGARAEFSYEFQVDGTSLISKLNGTREGKTLAGTYRTTTADGATRVDEGAFRSTAEQ